METSRARIEREISIDASAEKVWELIRRPGWWINDGEVVDHAIDPDSDGNSVTLRVVESGFDSLGGSVAERHKHLDGNAEGWRIELAAARPWAARP